MTKTILGRYGNDRSIGSATASRSARSSPTTALGAHISPFLLLDYAGPHDFAPTSERRGVGQHPHRGFETVTIVYDGEVEHRDSAGNGGVIGPGDVQWMTAAGGIIHEEYHSPGFAKTGGPFRMVQLWVNLPAKDKMAPGGYQGILNADMDEGEHLPGTCVEQQGSVSQNKELVEGEAGRRLDSGTKSRAGRCRWRFR